MVWGSVMIACGGCGLAWMYFGASMIPADQVQQMPPMNPGMGAIGAMVVGMGFDVLLIVAGATTVGRKPIGRPLHLTFAVLALPLFVVSMYFNMQHQANIEEWVKQNPDTPTAKAMQGGAGAIGQIVGWVMGIVLGLAYPIFLLVWFGLVKRKPSDMGVVSTQDLI